MYPCKKHIEDGQGRAKLDAHMAISITGRGQGEGLVAVLEMRASYETRLLRWYDPIIYLVID